jgi:quercetin dioxygenase-like cupin family protein
MFYSSYSYIKVRKIWYINLKRLKFLYNSYNKKIFTYGRRLFMETSQRNKLKNIEAAKAIRLEEELSYQKGQVVSKTLVQNKSVSLTLFSFDKGEEISSHSSDGDAMVTVLDGIGRFIVGEEEFILNKGETLIMPNNIPHAVYGEEQFKMLLTVIF